VWREEAAHRSLDGGGSLYRHTLRASPTRGMSVMENR
jgi:hypothetical protein